MVRKILLCFILIFSCSLSFAFDFGFILNQNAEFSGRGNDPAFEYRGMAIPRFEWLLGRQGSLYVSAGFSYETFPFGFVPELLRTDLSLRSGGFEFKLGRMHYSDPLGFIARGLFDGAQFSLNTSAGRFSAGGWYTGLLYKGRANIEMTNQELMRNNAVLDYNNFSGTYFAPRRLLAVLEWEHQGLGERAIANMAILGQFDLSGGSLHSQFLAGKILIPVGPIRFNLGGSFQLLQTSGELDFAYAGEAGIALQFKTQRLALMGLYSSGQSNNFAAFLPLTTVSQSSILGQKLSGLSIASLDYSARLHRNFSLGLSSYYFIRNDLVSNSHLGTAGRLIGPEFYGGLYFSPFSDLSLNLGGGAFIPALGNAAPNGETLWCLKLSVIISFF